MHIHGNIVEALGSVVSCAFRAAKFLKSGRGLVNWILGVCKTAPVAAVDEEDRHWKG